MTAPSTQLAAHAAIKPTRSFVRALVLDAITSFGVNGLTADECSSLIDVDKLTVRPRTSELFSDGLIRDSGDRRANASGKRAIVWVAA